TEDGAPRRRTKKGILQLAVIHLRQRLCSSSRALAESLAHLAESERISPQYRVIATQLAKRAERIKTHAKLDVLTKLLKETPDRVVVFSDHRPTIQLIEERVKQLNRKPIVYWGAHSTADRDKRSGAGSPKNGSPPKMRKTSRAGWKPWASTSRRAAPPERSRRSSTPSSRRTTTPCGSSAGSRPCRSRGACASGSARARSSRP